MATAGADSRYWRFGNLWLWMKQGNKNSMRGSTERVGGKEEFKRSQEGQRE